MHSNWVRLLKELLIKKPKNKCAPLHDAQGQAARKYNQSPEVCNTIINIRASKFRINEL